MIFFSTQSTQRRFLFQLELEGDGALPRGYIGRGMNLTTHHHLSVIIRVNGFTTPAIILPLLGVYRNNFNFTGYAGLVNFWDLRKLTSLIPLSNKRTF
jgi:hypothetical protein